MGSEILVPMPEEVMEYFCEQVLKRDWPNSIHAYYFIKNAFKWRGKSSNSQFMLLYLVDDVENGTFIGIRSQKLEKDYADVIVAYTSPGNEEQLKRVLMSTIYIEWGKKLLFQAIPDRLKHIVLTAIEERGLESELHMNYLTWMSADVAATLEYEVPSDVYIDRLGTEHIDQIHSLWVLNHTHPKSDLLDTVSLNFGLGVFSCDDSQLLAWALCSSYGGLTALTVHPNCRERGLGKLIATAVTKEMGQSGITPHAIVYQPNSRPLRLIERVGYVKLSTTYIFIFVKDRDTTGP